MVQIILESDPDPDADHLRGRPSHEYTPCEKSGQLEQCFLVTRAKIQTDRQTDNPTKILSYGTPCESQGNTVCVCQTRKHYLCTICLQDRFRLHINYRELCM